MSQTIATLDILDTNDVLLIEMGAMRSALNRVDSGDAICVPLEINDDDYRSAIAKMFGESPHWQSWMLESLLAEFKEYKASETSIQDMSGVMLRSVINPIGDYL